MPRQARLDVPGALHHIMVRGINKSSIREGDQAIVQGGDGFQVQVVGRLVEDQGVGASQHHLGKHAADPLATGEDRYQ